MDERRGAFGGARDGFCLGRDEYSHPSFNLTYQVAYTTSGLPGGSIVPPHRGRLNFIIIHIHHCAFHRSTANCPPKKR